MIRKLEIFDFDHTVMSTVNEEYGKRTWEQLAGEPFPDPDYYKSTHSLDIRLPHKPKWEIVDRVDVSLRDRSILTILMTGRKTHLKSDIIELCDHYNIRFQKYFCTPAHIPTLEYKLKKLAYLIDEFSDVTEVEMWDDRHHHADAFEALGRSLNVPVFVNRV